MNSTHTLPAASLPLQRPSPSSGPGSALDTLQSRFALRVASRLTEGAESLPSDISERLRFAREQALQKARAASSAAEGRPARVRSQATARSGATGWRLRLAGVIPLLALAGGLLLIQSWQDNSQIAAAAEIDAALLSDDLPPTAYSDAGFVEYLKSPSE